MTSRHAVIVPEWWVETQMVKPPRGWGNHSAIKEFWCPLHQLEVGQGSLLRPGAESPRPQHGVIMKLPTPSSCLLAEYRQPAGLYRNDETKSTTEFITRSCNMIWHPQCPGNMRETSPAVYYSNSPNSNLSQQHLNLTQNMVIFIFIILQIVFTVKVDLIIPSSGLGRYFSDILIFPLPFRLKNGEVCWILLIFISYVSAHFLSQLLFCTILKAVWSLYMNKKYVVEKTEKELTKHYAT